MSAQGPVRAAELTRSDWETPQAVFDWLDRLFRFDCDAAASYANRKVGNHINVEADALSVPWEEYGTRFFCNPPYGDLGKWIGKFTVEAKTADIIVALLPANTDTLWFHRVNETANTWLLTKRLAFEIDGKPQSGNTGGSMICIWGMGAGQISLRSWQGNLR